MSDRYISGRQLPDKAIDLVDEACARIKTQLDSMPTDLDTMLLQSPPPRNRGKGPRQGKPRRKAPRRSPQGTRAAALRFRRDEGEVGSRKGVHPESRRFARENRGREAPHGARPSATTTSPRPPKSNTASYPSSKRLSKRRWRRSARAIRS